MAFNMIELVFIILFIITAIMGFLYPIMDILVPQLLIKSNRYEKYTYFFTEHVCLSTIDVPLTWFKHFYKFSVIGTSLLLALTISRFLYQAELSENIYWTLDELLGNDRKALVSPETTLLAVLLLTIHYAQRSYEIHFVNKFDDKDTRELCNYIFAFFHYGTLMASVVGESEGFVRGSSFELQWKRLTYSQLICAPLFVLASFLQLRTNCILANMPAVISTRKKFNHKVKLPRGGLFEYVSGAIELTETIVYLTLAIVLRQSWTFYYIFMWTLANEATMAVFSHIYHRKYCAQFPRNRRVFIPFIL